jgi:hypothetical protein
VTGESCSHCGSEFGYEPGWDDPPEGEGHIEVTWNPDDEPSFVVSETRKYCSLTCVEADAENHPFENGTEEAADGGGEGGE